MYTKELLEYVFSPFNSPEQDGSHDLTHCLPQVTRTGGRQGRRKEQRDGLGLAERVTVFIATEALEHRNRNQVEPTHARLVCPVLDLHEEWEPDITLWSQILSQFRNLDIVQSTTGRLFGASHFVYCL